MKYPNFREEKKLSKKGYKTIVGIDEVGRGPLAGPVVACAFLVSRSLASKEAKLPSSIKDSKQLSPKQRKEIYKLLKKNPNVRWGIGKVSEKVIDKINIFEATKLAMKKAVDSLEKNLKMGSCQKIDDRRFFGKIDFLLIDGNFGINSEIPQKSIIKGDEKVFSISAASIIAKVFRDRLMTRYHKKYPKYCFNKNKGYPTILHKQKIKEFGLCPLHRQTFHFS